MGVALGYALLAYDSLARGLGKLEVNPQALADDLDSSWEVLAEAHPDGDASPRPAQPVRAPQELTRGKAITKESIQAFIETLELPEDEKARLRAMTPGNYIGKAIELAKRV